MGTWLLVTMMIVRMNGFIGVVWRLRRSRLGSGIVRIVGKAGCKERALVWMMRERGVVDRRFDLEIEMHSSACKEMN